jgi:hypothetical protein
LAIKSITSVCASGSNVIAYLPWHITAGSRP